MPTATPDAIPRLDPSADREKWSMRSVDLFLKVDQRLLAHLEEPLARSVEVDDQRENRRQGANDHEADWEQCFVFLEEHADGSSAPVWFARAAHDEVGADLRRRWDDPLLQLEGDHPVVFAGAGSHAAYVEPGEYLQSVPLRLPRRVQSTATAVRRFWTVTSARERARHPAQPPRSPQSPSSTTRAATVSPSDLGSRMPGPPSRSTTTSRG